MHRNVFRRILSREGLSILASPAILAIALAIVPLSIPTVAHAALELTPYGGYVWWDDETLIKDSAHYGGKLGYYFGPIGIEGNIGFSPADVDTLTLGGSDNDVHILNYSGNLVWRLAPDAKVVPYILGGVGLTSFEFGGGLDTSRVSYDAGAGVLFRLSDRFGLRFEGRDLMFKLGSAFNDNLRHNIIATGGLAIAFGGGKDTDKDKIPDNKDKCPDTPLGARVDEEGCPIDSDKDGVPDGIDQCADTPAGASVDAHGCPSDADKDGVLDGIDRCPDTPSGVAVDETGCPKDSDGDGITDDKDQCPNTPAGTAVDDKGCPKDSDADGVSDDKDLCPNTQAGVKVDKDGCPIEISEREVEMLDKGMITIRNLHFETAKWDILPQDEPVLNELGGIFIQWPQLRIEIGGHADWRGSTAYNQGLSEKRANSVRDWLLAHYPQINAANFSAVGYGESKPVATNKTQTGMAMNRRVEFKVMNPEELTKYKERKRTLKTGE